MPPRSLSPPRPLRPAAGFTVLELMVVVAIISIIGALAVPTFQRLQTRTRAAAIVNDFRIFANGIQTYAVEHGAYPPEAAAGVIPAGTHQSLGAAFTRATPMGGKYDWENNQMQLDNFRPRAAIAISPAADAPLSLTAVTISMLYALDLAIDNEIGGWNTGHFRLSNSMLPLYVIEP